MIADAALQTRPRERLVLLIMLLLALGLLLLGVFLPLMTVEKFWIIENSFSLLSGLWRMLLEGRWVLALVIASFSVLLPLLKIAVLLRVLGFSACASGSSETLARSLHWMHLYGKWSMLDVFVVAVLLASVKLGALAQVQIHTGLYAFGLSVVISMAITARVSYLIQQASRQATATAVDHQTSLME
ncbi:MAG: paraquat-inducible protein A [Motiliproteus sp.]|jgi:paraquat-inducible protein A